MSSRLSVARSRWRNLMYALTCSSVSGGTSRTFLNRPNRIVSVILPPKEGVPPRRTARRTPYASRRASSAGSRWSEAGLLDLDLGPGVLELLRELVGLFLRNARLDRLAAR